MHFLLALISGDLKKTGAPGAAGTGAGAPAPKVAVAKAPEARDGKVVRPKGIRGHPKRK